MNNPRSTIFPRFRAHRGDAIAFLLALAGFLASAVVTQRVFEAIPHIEDEIAYVWQAKALDEGHLKIASPPQPRSFLVPFVVDYQGERFGKYPPGWPAVLALTILLGGRAWVNPLLAGLGVWLTYQLGKRFFSQQVGLLAAALTVTSPFFLMNSGSLLSHPFGLVLSSIFALGWLEAFWQNNAVEPAASLPSARRRWGYTLLAALALGSLILTRPFTAMAVALPFAIHGCVIMFRAERGARIRLLVFCLLAVLFIGLYFLWQYALTGDALLNPYTLWWPYDRIGFGPGIGHTPSGHTLQLAWINTRFSLQAGSSDLFGWWKLSWLLLPFGIWASRRNPRGVLLGSVVLSLVLAYMAYWIGATLFGPRYYYEGLYSLTLISAAGACWLAGWPLSLGQRLKVYPGWRKLRPLMVTLILGVIVGINLTLYLPIRLEGMVGLYSIERADQLPFETPAAQAQTPALVIVHVDRWMEYGALLDLENPDLTSPFIFAWNNSPLTTRLLAEAFPERTVYHYYPGKPFQLYRQPLPEPE